MALELKVPSVGESVTSVEIGEWLKAEGDSVAKDEVVVVLDTEKATVELPAPEAGTLLKILKRKGESAGIGEAIGEIEEGAAGRRPILPEAREAAPVVAPQAAAPAARREQPPAHQQPAPARPASPPSHPLLEKTVLRSSAAAEIPERTEEVVRMSLWRRTIARRLQQATHEAALLTTFNEIDMSLVGQLRSNCGGAFEKKHQVRLGLMSFFVKAAVAALNEFPEVNAEVRGEDIVYHNYCDIGIAVSTGQGLVVPVLRPAERLSFAEIEKAIADFSARSKNNTLRPDELEGGTFTITNGGVFGSLSSTPIVNPPQSAILGLHAIQDRPVARSGHVVIRPMMNVALTYDHRIIDGREAVLFLRRVKDVIEDPARMLIEA